MEGDELLAVDGQSVENLTYEEVKEVCLGEDGSVASFQFAREPSSELPRGSKDGAGTWKRGKVNLYPSAHNFVVEMRRDGACLPPQTERRDVQQHPIPLDEVN